MPETDDWRQLLCEALVEPDPVKLRPIVDACQAAIVERLRTVKYADDGASVREKLFEGIKILRRLQVDRLHYPARPAL